MEQKSFKNRILLTFNKMVSTVQAGVTGMQGDSAAMFNYDPARYRDALDREGYVHLKSILTDDFLDSLTGFFEAALADANKESADWRIAKKKRQFVYEFPSDEAAETFRTRIAELTGIDADTLTISERHIKLYEPDAAPYPAPHKDRAASSFSIGFPIKLPQGSSVCVFPDLDPGPNEEERAVFLDTGPDGSAEAMYASDSAKVLNEELGDMIVFLGSAIYHERMRGAGTAVLYIKINGEGADPLGEHISGKTVAA
jgi:hypothetical protein